MHARTAAPHARPGRAAMAGRAGPAEFWTLFIVGAPSGQVHQRDGADGVDAVGLCVVQSNAPAAEPAGNAALRINSGFYEASYRGRRWPRSRRCAIVARCDVAATEQPSFYHVLCGGKDGTRRVGTSACTSVSGSTVSMGVVSLDRRTRGGGHGRHWDQNPSSLVHGFAH